MKLFRHGSAGKERPGMLDSAGVPKDLTGVVADIGAANLSPEMVDRLRAVNPDSLPLVPLGTRLGPCVSGVGKLICIGLNYRDHAAEAGMHEPDEPILFMKATSAICGPNDPIVLPPGSRKTDWEAELGVVIGTPAHHVIEQDAMAHIAGYCIVNDVSERAHQLERGGQWVKGKSADTFGPIGPWLVTSDEVPDPQDLQIWLDLDGQRMQSGTTANMIFGVRALVAYVSRFMTLLPGDIIATGTPAGVGMGQKPDPVYLRPGNQLKLGIDGLGEQSHIVVASNFDVGA